MHCMYLSLMAKHAFNDHPCYLGRNATVPNDVVMYRFKRSSWMHRMMAGGTGWRFLIVAAVWLLWLTFLLNFLVGNLRMLFGPVAQVGSSMFSPFPLVGHSFLPELFADSHVLPVVVCVTFLKTIGGTGFSVLSCHSHHHASSQLSCRPSELQYLHTRSTAEVKLYTCTHFALFFHLCA